MKAHIVTTVLTTLLVPTPLNAQTPVNVREFLNQCAEKHREYQGILKHDTILHVTCKDDRHFFFQIKDRMSSVGILLNATYPIHGKNLRITNDGPYFFIVKKKYGNGQYCYTFKTNSWSYDEIKPPGWSSGDREE